MQLMECNQEKINVEKIWLSSYPPGVPAEINPDAYSSLVEMFQTSCRQFNDKSAFYCMGKTLSYQQLENYTRSVSAYFQQSLKLKKGDPRVYA